MLTILATHYVSPLSEVELGSIPLTVHLVNVADETGLVTGRFRVYNNTTGLLVHTSDIAPLSMAAGTAVDVSALTDFEPAAPADDVYFVVFDGHASNALVPDGIGIFLGAFHFDVKAVGMGDLPSPHASTHEDGGSDEMDVDGLSGFLANPQTPIPHKTSHQNGGSDELSVDGLSGTLADAQTPAAHDHAGDTLKFSVHVPVADATTELQFKKQSDSSIILNIDSSNKRVGVLTATPTSALDVVGDIGLQTKLYARNGGTTVHFIELNHNSAFQKFTIGSTLRMIITTTGTGMGNITPTAKLDVDSDIIRLRTAKTPATAGAAGNAGDFAWDADFWYICIAANTWRRIQHQTW